MLNEKRGQLTQYQLIVIILAVVGFVILLFMLGYFPFHAIATEEICHNSIVLRAVNVNLPVTQTETHPLKSTIPLKCKTQYIQIKTSEVGEIKRQIAEEMRKCWSMLGEGKLDFISGGPFGESGVCLLCSVISFDKPVQKQIKTIDKDSFFDYLNHSIIPGQKITYLQYFTNTEFPEKPKELYDINTSKQYAVLFSMGKAPYMLELLTGGAGAGLCAGIIATAAAKGFAIGFIAPGPGNLIGAGAGAIIGGAACFIGGYKFQEWWNGVITPGKTPEEKENQKKFWASLTLVPYDAQGLQTACKNIVSVP